MIVVIENGSLGVEKSSLSIPKGTTFRGRIGLNPSRLFFKVHQNIIGLDHNDDGSAVWRDCTVEDYVPVNIEIRIL